MENLKFLASKSEFLLTQQRESYRNKRTMASAVIGVIAVFIPLFINGISEINITFKYLAVVPIIILAISGMIMLKIMFSRPLDFSFSVNKFPSLVKEKYNKVLLFEIGANVASFNQNKSITASQNKMYNRGVGITILGILIAIIILILGNIIHLGEPEKQDFFYLINK